MAMMMMMMIIDAGNDAVDEAYNGYGGWVQKGYTAARLLGGTR